MEIYILYIYILYLSGVSRGFQTLLYWFRHPNYVPKIKKNWSKTTLFHDIFNVNVSTPSQTFNLSISFKIIELKTLCMPVSACLFKCISKYCFCIYKPSLHIVLVPKLNPGYNTISRVESNKFDNINNKI